MPNVFDSSTVMTPSLPTLSSASAMVSPISGEAAEMAATCAISSLPSTSRAWAMMFSTAAVTPFSMPFFSDIGLAPAATFFIPRFTIARASTVAVVVPSPATSLVFVATSLASCAPMFSHGSSSSTSFAMVTPSFVMVGAPHFLSRTTLRPRGPSVIETASASLSTPASSALRASSVNFSCFAAMDSPSTLHTPQAGLVPGPRAKVTERVLLLDDREDVAGRQDQVVVALDRDLGAAVLRVDDLVADLHVDGDEVALLQPAGPDGDELALLGLLLGRVRDDDPGDRGLLGLAGLDHDAVLERLQIELLRHCSLPASLAL